MTSAVRAARLAVGGLCAAIAASVTAGCAQPANSDTLSPSPSQSPATTALPTTPPSPSIPATPVALPLVQPASYQPCEGTVQAVAGGGVWVMTAGSLLLSSDQGATWSDATPPGVNLSASTWPIFCALNGRDAWLASVAATGTSGGPAQVGVWQTTDSGDSWTRLATIADPSEAYPTAIQFVDADHGWLMMYLAGMAKVGLLFGTVDGGASWSQLTEQGTSFYAGQLDFVSDTQGWVAFQSAGSAGEGVDETTDGGRTWTPSSAPFLAAVDGDWCVELEGFRFLSPSFGVAATTSYGCGGAAEFEVWTTSDGAASWQEVASWAESAAGPVSCGFDAISATAWVDLDCDSVYSVSALHWSFDGGATWVTVAASGLPYNASPATFADSHTGYVLPVSSTPNSLFSTTDSGQSWASVSLG